MPGMPQIRYWAGGDIAEFAMPLVRPMNVNKLHGPRLGTDGRAAG